MSKTRSQRTLIGRNKNVFYWLIGERTKLQRRTQLYGVSLRTKKNLKKRSDLPGEINSDIKNMCSNKQNATLKQKIIVQDNKKILVLGLKIDGKIWPIPKCSEAEKLTSKKKTSREEAETD